MHSSIALAEAQPSGTMQVFMKVEKEIREKHLKPRPKQIVSSSLSPPVAKDKLSGLSTPMNAFQIEYKTIDLDKIQKLVE